MYRSARALLEGRLAGILVFLATLALALSVACILPGQQPGDDDTSGDDDDDDTGDDDTGDDDTGDDDTGDDDTGDDDTGDDDTGDDDTTGDDDDDVTLQPSDDTNNAPVITQPGTYLGDTSSLSNTYADPSVCTGWAADGYDGVYRIPLNANQTLDLLIQYDQDLQDASIYISDDPASPDLNCLAGADIEYDNGLEILSYTAVNDGLYYLVVDGYYASMGEAFSLEVNF